MAPLVHYSMRSFFEAVRLRLVVLNPIKHSCSFIKQYIIIIIIIIVIIIITITAFFAEWLFICNVKNRNVKIKLKID